MVNIDINRCTGCGNCVDDCVAGNIRLENGVATCINSCILCGHCVAICPSEAVSILQYDMADIEAFDKNRFKLDPDNLLHSIKLRRSIRQYAYRPLEREKLQQIAQAGRYTATAVNRQECRFIMVQDNLTEFKALIWGGIERSLKSTSAESTGALARFKEFVDLRSTGTDYLFRDAPVVLYIAANNAVDAALAAQNMELMALSLGIGALYNGFLVYAANESPEAQAWLGTQDKPIQICMLMGYPRVSYRRSAPRKPADVSWR